MHITLVAGTRPNFIKIFPIIREIQKQQAKGFQLSFSLVHTGQHYDQNMSEQFFKDLNIPEPDFIFDGTGENQSIQTGKIMAAFEAYLSNNKTNLVIVVGDVNSTMACSIVAKKMNVDLAHVEAGIRSGDNSMPEEINRKVTDAISDVFFTTTTEASNQLLAEGKDAKNIYFVGNVMIDTLTHGIKQPVLPHYQIPTKEYAVVTLHRPSNVDSVEKLAEILNILDHLSEGMQYIFPVHPRTAKILEQFKNNWKNFSFRAPCGYLEFLHLIRSAKFVVTDSGGISEETTVLGIPCLTLRSNTERPETCSIGSNTLIGEDFDLLKDKIAEIHQNRYKKSSIPELWDGETAKRILTHICERYQIKKE